MISASPNAGRAMPPGLGASSPHDRALTRSGSPQGTRRYVLALLAVAAALAGAHLLAPVAGTENVDLVFLVAVIGAAARCGLGPSLVASLASVLLYNFFFLAPVHTFAIADATNVAAFVFFLVVALVTSHLAARARTEAIRARERADATEALHRFSREIADVAEPDELIHAILRQVSAMLSLESVLLLPDAAGDLAVRARSPDAAPLDPLDLLAAQAAWSPARPRDQPMRDTLRAGSWLFLSMRTGEGMIGALGVSPDWARDPPSVEERQLLGALVNQAAVAVRRLQLAAERDEARLSAEKERLHSTLLASLSHDLKTPLASITGAVTALRQYGELYDPNARDELAGMIQDEAERLTRFVVNLLDMTRLEAGGLRANLQPVDLGDVVGAALQRTENVLAAHEVEVAITPDLPMLKLDPVLFEQVLVNLFDNAAKYAPPGSRLTVSARRRGEAVVLTVADEGPGLAPGDAEPIFDKFYRAEAGDNGRAGTGLGLAICRGFVTAMGGTIAASNRSDGVGGAQFTVAFPASTFAAAPPRRDPTE